MPQKDVIILLKSDFNRLISKVDLILSKIDKSGKSAFQYFDDWIPEKEVKKLLGLNTTSLWKLRKEGKLEFSKPNNSAVYYSKESILNWLDSNRKLAFQQPKKSK